MRLHSRQIRLGEATSSHPLFIYPRRSGLTSGLAAVAVDRLLKGKDVLVLTASDPRFFFSYVEKDRRLPVDLYRIGKTALRVNGCTLCVFHADQADEARGVRVDVIILDNVGSMAEDAVYPVVLPQVRKHDPDVIAGHSGAHDDPESFLSAGLVTGFFTEIVTLESVRDPSAY